MVITTVFITQRHGRDLNELTYAVHLTEGLGHHLRSRNFDLLSLLLQLRDNYFCTQDCVRRIC